MNYACLSGGVVSNGSHHISFVALDRFWFYVGLFKLLVIVVKLLALVNTEIWIATLCVDWQSGFEICFCTSISIFHEEMSTWKGTNGPVPWVASLSMTKPLWVFCPCFFLYIRKHVVGKTASGHCRHTAVFLDLTGHIWVLKDVNLKITLWCAGSCKFDVHRPFLPGLFCSSL